MSFKNWLLAIVEAVLWYYFAVTALGFIAESGDIKQTALKLVVTGYLAAVACPLMRNSEGWRRAWSGK